MRKVFDALWPPTLKAKIRLALFATAFLPFVFMLIYVEESGKERMIDDTLKIRHAQMAMVKERIGQTVSSLQKEAGFLASLDMMNDMLVNDVDKRIAQLLLHKRKDLSFDVALYAVDTHGAIVASTTRQVHKPFAYMLQLKEASERQKRYFIADKRLFLFAPVASSLQEGTMLGTLVIAYPLSQLSRFAPARQEGVHTLFYFPQSALQIGNMPHGESLQAVPYKKNDYISKAYLILSEQLDGVLSGGFLVYMVEKSEALSFLHDFVRLIWTLFFAGLLVIALLSWWIGERVLKPVHRLSEATKRIITTQDYTMQVPVSSEGEMRELSRNFNRMVSEVDHTLRQLEEENRLRLLRFTQLITIFNRLIQTKEEDACIALALEELRTLLPGQALHFTPDFPAGTERDHHLLLYVKDFEAGSSRYYGAIVLKDTGTIEDPNEIRFYEAIATMIMLQLDQIGLISRIHSVSEAKSVFISHMSHELRTPLHTILSATQYLIGYEGLTPAQQERVGTIESSAGHLLGMINDILDLAQIEAGKAPVEIVGCESADIAGMIGEAVQMLEVLAEQNSTQIRFVNDAASLSGIRTDRKYFKQILINLLSNAIKFTQEGRIDIRMERCGRQLCVRLKDSGRGLEEKELSQLFDAFTQLNDTQKEKGSGLGLVISRKLAALFGGELYLESEGRGKGVTATVKLPLTR